MGEDERLVQPDYRACVAIIQARSARQDSHLPTKYTREVKILMLTRQIPLGRSKFSQIRQDSPLNLRKTLISGQNSRQIYLITSIFSIKSPTNASLRQYSRR